MDSVKKVLIIEDDNELRKTLRGHFSPMYEVMEAADGEEGVAMCLDHKPDLILLDLLLPKLDGFKVLERIRKYPEPALAATKVIVLSNLWSEKDILMAKGLKIDHYFVKPNTKIQEVLDRVREVLFHELDV